MRCPRCNGLVDRGDRFCRHCGGPLTPGSSAGETVINPFLALKTRWGVVLAVLGIALAWSVLRIDSPDSDGRPPHPALFLSAVITVYGPVALWIYWTFRSKGIDVRRLVGRLPRNYNWFPAIGVLLVNMAFSLGAAIVVSSAITLALDPVARLSDTEPIVSDAPNPASVILWIVTVAVPGPIFEELFCRGVLVNRWAVKWRPGTAIVASALLFGVLHLIVTRGAFIGQCMFGMVSAVFYVRTRTLLVPMGLHIANNSLVVMILILLDSTTGIGEATAITVGNAEVPAMVFGLALLVLTTPILVWYLRKNWPRRDDKLPYEAARAEPMRADAEIL